MEYCLLRDYFHIHIFLIFISFNVFWLGYHLIHFGSLKKSKIELLNILFFIDEALHPRIIFLLDCMRMEKIYAIPFHISIFVSWLNLVFFFSFAFFPLLNTFIELINLFVVLIVLFLLNLFLLAHGVPCSNCVHRFVQMFSPTILLFRFCNQYPD